MTYAVQQTMESHAFGHLLAFQEYSAQEVRWRRHHAEAAPEVEVTRLRDKVAKAHAQGKLPFRY